MRRELARRRRVASDWKQVTLMLDALGFRESLLVNVIGHATGVLLFGLFLLLFARDQRGAQRRRNWLPVATALLALLWNLGSLAVLTAEHYGLAATDALVAFSFSVLSLLPALLLHLSLEGQLRPIWLTGYGLSAVAMVLHVIEVSAFSSRLHQLALLLITAGFGLLTVVALLVPRQGSESFRTRAGSRVWGTMSLFLFAVSFVHFGTEQNLHGLWSAEVAFHHAGIPLALLVLLQDYRFLLLDAFLRFLVNAVAAAAFLGVSVGLEHQFHLLARAKQDPLVEGLLVVAGCLLLILFAFCRSYLQRWLTRQVFRRPALGATEDMLQRLANQSSDEDVYLRQAGICLAEFVGTVEVELLPHQPEDETPLAPQPITDRTPWRQRTDLRWAEAAIPLRFSSSDVRWLLLGRRRGGRRYLSEDLASLGQLAATVVDQVERLRRAEMDKLVSQAELRALQAQINPHFLFNSLNTLYGTIARENAEARRLVLNLADVFRYFLQSEKTFISLDEEVRIVEAYLEIESLRLGSRLTKRIEVDDSARSTQIPVLSIQPLVENAVKHGVATQPEPGTVRLRVVMTEQGVRIRVEDSGSGFRADSSPSGNGVGLENVRRRLQLCYGPAADLDIQSTPQGCAVEFLVPVNVPLGAIC